MRVHHFSTYPHGGASTAALRLHDALAVSGIASTFHYTLCDRDPPRRSGLQPLRFVETPRLPIVQALNRRWQRARGREVVRQYEKHLAQRPSELETFSMAELVEPTRLPALFGDGAVAHLHWIAFLADYPTFFGSLPFHIPIVWTLHDMNPITGGCHFSGGCDRFVAGCGNCPQIVNPQPDDVSAHGMAVKTRALKQRQIHVVTPSRWLGRLAQQSPVWPKDTAFSVIHYGLDLDVFRPTDKRNARRQLGLQTDATLVGFCADQLDNPRKGAAYLRQAIAARSNSTPIELITFGRGSMSDVACRVHHLGYLEEPSQQAVAYSACDLVVVPSLEDNQPQVAVESLACGTPVVGFQAGGLGEVVSDGLHGRVVPVGNAEALAHAIDWMVAQPEARSVMSQRGVMYAAREFDSHQQAAKYRNVYREELELARRRRAGAA